MGKFEIFKDDKGEYRFRLKASNGEIIAQSEGYTRKENAEKGVDAVIKYSASAETVDLTE